MRVVFVDPGRFIYDSKVLQTKGLGGTESTVVRIAQSLSTSHSVTVLQNSRVDSTVESATLSFLPMSALDEAVADADHVVFINKAQHIKAVAAKSPARLWVWLHNFLKEEVPLYWQDHLRFRLGIICVSQTHLEHTKKYLRSLPAYWASFSAIARGGLLFHHNPLPDELAPDHSVVRDPNKLVFFSSPHKGIEQVIADFRAAYAQNDQLRLYVANPGYKSDSATLLDVPGIVRLGTLPQQQVMRHLREALCVFYTQRKQPETFGLIYAEANAVGTPVLAHDFGAASEILASNNAPINALDTDLVVKTVLEWSRSGGPSTQADPKFMTKQVAEKWDEFLRAPDSFIQKINNRTVSIPTTHMIVPSAIVQPD